MKEERVIGGILGVVSGDALGLPIQFLSREKVKLKPVTGMQSGGAFGTPAGTWSDDSSLTLCLTESLVEVGYDLKDIAHGFVRWYRDGYCTPFDYSFDIGGATSEAMDRLLQGVTPLEAGPTDEHSNGNGSLMRILPVALYFSHLPDEVLITKVCEVSKITHGHPRCQLGCSLYALLVQDLLRGAFKAEAYHKLRLKAQTIFAGLELEKELQAYHRIINGTLPSLEEDEIKSSGYVVHTLEAAIWCLLNTQSFEEAVLKAVNLGDDADTVGAVAGGLAGVYYGFASIPEVWLSQIIKFDEILELCRKFAVLVDGFHR